ncbi:MAG: hypothetical protein ACI9N9_000975 [Enterobacterales bacterium]|jgi:hypothetical protein
MPNIASTLKSMRNNPKAYQVKQVLQANYTKPCSSDYLATRPIQEFSHQHQLSILYSNQFRHLSGHHVVGGG